MSLQCQLLHTHHPHAAQHADVGSQRRTEGGERWREEVTGGGTSKRLEVQHVGGQEAEEEVEGEEEEEQVEKEWKGCGGLEVKSVWQHWSSHLLGWWR